MHGYYGPKGESRMQDRSSGMNRPRVLEQIRKVQIDHHAEVAIPDFPRIEKIVKRLRRLPPGRLLDVGYSKGGFADYLAEAGWECIGLDINEHRGQKVGHVQCDLNEFFPVKSESCDLIAAGEVIEHMLDEGAFLEECHRVLKKGGTLVLTTPNLAFLPNRFLMLFGKTPLFVYTPYHYHFHTKKTLTAMTEQHGFDVTQVVSSHILYSRRRHASGRIFETLGDWFPTFGAHLILFARKK